MSSKFDKPMAKYLEQHGFEAGEFDPRKNVTRWTRRGAPDVLVHGGLAEHAYRTIVRTIDKLDGVKSMSAIRKRDTTAIKARQQTARERLTAERNRHQEELAEYERRMGERLGGMTNQEWSAVCAEIERREREIRELERLMTELPDSGHRGVEHAKHRA